MFKQFKYIVLTAFTGTVCQTYAQERKQTNDTIDTQVVTVVKPYTPTISDAFKIKEEPTLDDKTTATKKEVKYNIFSIPVASTFTPAKGKAEAVAKTKSVKLYDNYASLGLGTFTTILGEVYLNHKLSNTETVGGYFSHHSSQGGIDGLLLDDKFSNTNLHANFTQRQRDYTWRVDGGGKFLTYNWYGLPQPYFDGTTANDLNVKHAFYNANVGGKIIFDDAIAEEASLRFRHFGDDQGSSENRLLVKGTFGIPVMDETIKTEVTVDYLGGSFERNYYSEDKLEYGNFNVGLAPSYQLVQDDLTLNLGIGLVYLNNTKDGDNKLYIYPNITGSYRLVDELMIAFGGIEGRLIQNTYEDFAMENPFVSPTLLVVPTDQQYNATLGLKGKLTNTIGYSVSGNYTADRNKALFKANSVLGEATEDYQYGNSFGVVYDDVKTFSFEGELSVDINRNFNLGAKAAYFMYNTNNQDEAWNLPELKASLFADYQITEQWFAGASLFYVGERKDVFYEEGTLVLPIEETRTLDGYFDVNLHAGYRVNEKLSIFLKGNNLFNQDYERWMNYPVQGLQILGGATYQFDF
ncbi:TonB-dependent receptor domain-containing protein [Mangrovimonas sp. YM274]|uniref:TonB-dependent receptor domain-containing protein n=1 Tax=Mangrovimonas sp. YM274 TaxID=3070660 RepID=UPI0027DB85B1|nr:TonB-dependent receptor [Mangrovimonas sp. YM274]WMI68031.1 TonB-dependent receptor [Mangrovimonas sp. YM274]